MAIDKSVALQTGTRDSYPAAAGSLWGVRRCFRHPPFPVNKNFFNPIIIKISCPPCTCATKPQTQSLICDAREKIASLKNKREKFQFEVGDNSRQSRAVAEEADRRNPPNGEEERKVLKMH